VPGNYCSEYEICFLYLAYLPMSLQLVMLAAFVNLNIFCVINDLVIGVYLSPALGTDIVQFCNDDQ
jgi:hypothetical protein